MPTAVRPPANAFNPAPSSEHILHSSTLAHLKSNCCSDHYCSAPLFIIQITDAILRALIHFA